MKTKILIVEPSEVIVTGLRSVLGKQSRFELLPTAVDFDELEQCIAAFKPDVLLANPTLAPDAVRILSATGLPVAALIYQYVEPHVLKSMDAVVDIRDSAATIVQKLAMLADRKTADGTSHPANYELTNRELAVLVEVAKGKTNKEIADSLNVSIHTVITHRRNIMHKTGIKSVAGLTVFAMLNHLID